MTVAVINYASRKRKSAMSMSIKSLLIFLLIQLFLSCNNQQGVNNSHDDGEQAFRESFTSFDGTNISYLDAGKGQPVVLLHGFLNKAESWAGTPLNEQLRAQGYRVVIPDLRGNGQSDQPQTDVGYADDAEIRDLQLLLDHLGLDSVQVVGYSRGSILLAKWLTLDKRIDRAVIGGMGLDFTDPAWERRLAFATAFGDGPITEMTRGAVEYAESIGADKRSLHLQQKHQPVTLPEELRQVSIPILVVAGNEDKDNGNPGRLEELFPAGKLNIIPGDHNTAYRTEIFAAAVMAFLKEGRDK